MRAIKESLNQILREQEQTICLVTCLIIVNYKNTDKTNLLSMVKSSNISADSESPIAHQEVLLIKEVRPRAEGAFTETGVRIRKVTIHLLWLVTCPILSLPTSMFVGIQNLCSPDPTPRRGIEGALAPLSSAGDSLTWEQPTHQVGRLSPFLWCFKAT